MQSRIRSLHCDPRVEFEFDIWGSEVVCVLFGFEQCGDACRRSGGDGLQGVNTVSLALLGEWVRSSVPSVIPSVGGSPSGKDCTRVRRPLVSARREVCSQPRIQILLLTPARSTTSEQTTRGHDDDDMPRDKGTLVESFATSASSPLMVAATTWTVRKGRSGENRGWPPIARPSPRHEAGTSPPPARGGKLVGTQ
jgi:hypothetical protein